MSYTAREKQEHSTARMYERLERSEWLDMHGMGVEWQVEQGKKEKKQIYANKGKEAGMKVCPDCRGRCGRYDPNIGKMGTFYPCKKCKGNGVLTAKGHKKRKRQRRRG